MRQTGNDQLIPTTLQKQNLVFQLKVGGDMMTVMVMVVVMMMVMVMMMMMMVMVT